VIAAEHAVDGPQLTHDVIQVFRVPVSTTVAWVELAVPEGQEPAPPFELSIVEPMGLPAPPPGPLTSTTLTASFPPRESMSYGSTWAAGETFAGPVVLEPGRDYWLQARILSPWRVASAATATAADGVGPLYVRPPGDGPWIEAPGALAFRLIGATGGTTDAPTGPAPAGFLLSADPLPFSRQLSLRWSGGVGRAQVEIFDAGGRRVRHVRDAGLGTRGGWVWRGEDDAGRTVPAGVYFARVTPGAGAAVHRRVVYVR
jgi:hypothetical protein